MRREDWMPQAERQVGKIAEDVDPMTELTSSAFQRLGDDY
jgi:hypothetical protein